MATGVATSRICVRPHHRVLGWQVDVPRAQGEGRHAPSLQQKRMPRTCVPVLCIEMFLDLADVRSSLARDRGFREIIVHHVNADALREVGQIQPLQLINPNRVSIIIPKLGPFINWTFFSSFGHRLAPSHFYLIRYLLQSTIKSHF